MNEFQLILFPILWLILPIAGYLILYRHKKIDLKLLLLYVSFMAMIGPIGEVFVGTLYEAFVGQALWQYKIFPIHHAYTSLYAPVIWGISGVFLYWMNEIAAVWDGKRKAQKAILQMVETITLETALNVSFLLLTGGLMFYYLPGDLWHVTSVQTLPFYFVLGLVVPATIHHMKDYRRFFSALCFCLMIVVVYMV